MLKNARLVQLETFARARTSPIRAVLGSSTLGLLLLTSGCGTSVSRSATDTLPVSTAPSVASTEATTTTTTTVPCALSITPGTAETVPVSQVCSSSGAPYFDSPEAAMTYLAGAWNADNVQDLDYVTDPAGRQEMDSMATLMVNLQLKNCVANPGGDDTCYFTHDIAQSTSSTTYPNPMNYPPGEAVFTVAPASTSGWYLTRVVHCG